MKKKKYDYRTQTPENMEALERDNFTCLKCGSKESLVVHHIDESRKLGIKNMNRSLENLMTVCRTCHGEIHFGGSEERFKEVLRLKRTGMTFEQIGVKLGVTKQRVHQIWLRWKPLDKTPQVRNNAIIAIRKPKKMKNLKETKYHLSFHVDEKMHNDIRKLAYKDKRLKAAEARQLIKEAIQNRKEETK